MLKDVAEDGFTLKLQAFLSEANHDQLFLVPADNIQTKHEAFCQEHEARILSLAKFQDYVFQESPSRKTIVMVRPDDRYLLISSIFQLGPNPYKGLEVFEREDAERFFGREALTEQIWNTYQEQLNAFSKGQASSRFLAILGPSGSGKSSVVRAGFLHKLQQTRPPDMKPPIVFSPGKTPLGTLSEQLSRLATNNHTNTSTFKKSSELKCRHESILKKEFERGLKQDSIGGLSLITRKFFEDPLMLVVDQFEEVYSLCKNKDERLSFIRNLLSAAEDKKAKVTVVVVLRSDFFAHTWQPSELATAISNNQIPVFSIDRKEDLRRIITEPAKRAGYLFENTVVDELMAEIDGRETLPLLEFALTQIWEGLRKGEMPQQTLKRINGVGGALSEKAEQIYKNLPEADKPISRRAFLKLVKLDEQDAQYLTRHPVSLDNIAAQGEDLEQIHTVLRRFSIPEARLITLSQNEDGQVIAEVTHEALFTHWKRLQGWINMDREFLTWRTRLRTNMPKMDTGTYSEGDLLRGNNLNVAKEWLKMRREDLEPERSFIEASLQAWQRSQRRKKLAIGVVFILSILAFSVIIYFNQRWNVVSLTYKSTIEDVIKQLTTITTSLDKNDNDLKEIIKAHQEQTNELGGQITDLETTLKTQSENNRAEIETVATRTYRETDREHTLDKILNEWHALLGKVEIVALFQYQEALFQYQNEEGEFLRAIREIIKDIKDEELQRTLSDSVKERVENPLYGIDTMENKFRAIIWKAIDTEAMVSIICTIERGEIIRITTTKNPYVPYEEEVYDKRTSGFQTSVGHAEQEQREFVKLLVDSAFEEWSAYGKTTAEQDFKEKLVQYQDQLTNIYSVLQKYHKNFKKYQREHQDQLKAVSEHLDSDSEALKKQKESLSNFTKSK